MIAQRLSFLATASLVMALALSTTHAATIFQGAGADYIAFEAEENVTIGNDTVSSPTWNVAGDAIEASADSIWSDGDTATWTVQFNTAGTYRLYVKATYNDIGSPSGRSASGTPDQENSLWIGSTLGDANVTDADIQWDNNTVDALDTSPEWRFTGKIGGDSAITYEVAAGQVGVPTSFTVAVREDGYVIDRIVFSSNTALNDSALDALANSPIPEPASFVLLGLAAMIALSDRRRS